MEIEELKNNDHISHRAYMVCKHNNIHSLSELKKYFLSHGSLRGLENCGTEEIGEFLRLLNFKEEIKIKKSFSEFQEEEDDLLLIEFLKRGFLSRRTHNICRVNGIDTFQELKNYYNQFKTFRTLTRCGVKSNNELLALCEQEFDEKQKDFIHSIDEISIKGEKDQKEEPLIDYFNQNRISIRAFKVCTQNDIETLSQLRAFYKNYRTFQFLPNCGAITNKELKALSRRNAEKLSGFSNKEKEPNEILKMEIIQNPSNVDLHKTINKFIKEKYSLLTHASQNSLYVFFRGKISIPHINPILDPDFKIGRIPKIRAHSVSEIRIFIESIKDFIINTTEGKRKIEGEIK